MSTTVAGDVVWSQVRESIANDGLAVGSDGTVYVSTLGGMLRAFHGVSGTQKWACSLGWSAGPVAVGRDGTVYVWQAGMGALSAVTSSGMVKWGPFWLSNGGYAQLPGTAIDANGIVYFGSNDGYLVRLSLSVPVRIVLGLGLVLACWSCQ